MALNPKDNNLYITDTENHRIQVFDSDGNYETTLGRESNAKVHFESPVGIGVDPTGEKIYVADTENHRIQVFDSDGNHKLTFGSDHFGIDIDNGIFLIPRGISVDPVNNTVYVTDSNNRVQVFDSEGNFQMSFGEKGVDDGEFSTPQGITVNPNGNLLYVADVGNNRVQVFHIVAKNVEMGNNNGNYDDVLIKNPSEDTSVKDEKLDEVNGGGGCLIATATYGTELASQVQFLREIRDNTVMNTSSGAAFMSEFNQLYYSFSPTIADMERENPIFQQAVRAFITPMILSLSIMTLAESGSETEFDSDSSKIYYDDFADQDSSNPIPQSAPKPEPEPPHSEIDEFELSEELTTSLENTVRENTGFVSLDSEVYPVPYSSDPSYAIDVDGVFLSIVIPIIVVVAGIVLERVITKWYNKRKIKN